MFRNVKCFKYKIVQKSKCSRLLLVNCFLFAYFSPFISNTWDSPSVVIGEKWCSLNHFAIFAFYDIIFSVCVVECVSSYYCSTWPPTRWMGPEEQISLSLSLIFRRAQSKGKQCGRTDIYNSLNRETLPLEGSFSTIYAAFKFICYENVVTKNLHHYSDSKSVSFSSFELSVEFCSA